MGTTRREFLHLSGFAAIALPGTLESLSRSGGFQVAILGCGRAGQQHLRALVAQPEVTSIILCDPDAGARREAAGQCPAGMGPETRPLPLTHSDDWQDCLGRQRPDLVVIASPDGCHFSQIHQALRQGAAVVVESPVVSEWQEWQQLHRLPAREARRLFIAAPWDAEPSSATASRDDGWQQTWPCGNGVLGQHGWAVLDRALSGLHPGLPRRVFAAGDGAAFGEPASHTPGELLAAVEFESGTSLAWHERQGQRTVTIRGPDMATLRSLDGAALQRLAAPLPPQWQGILADLSHGVPSACRFGMASNDVATTWLAIKAALKSQCTVILDWPAKGHGVPAVLA